MRGRCSQIWTPPARVAIDLNSPRMPSGAWGFKSHMSMVGGPPESQTKITDWARRSRAGLAAWARASSSKSCGRPSPNSPAVPILRKSRRACALQPGKCRAITEILQLEPIISLRLRFRLVIQHEFTGVDQRPECVGERHLPVRRLAAIFKECVALAPGRPPRQRCQKQFFQDLLICHLAVE